MVRLSRLFNYIFFTMLLCLAPTTWAESVPKLSREALAQHYMQYLLAGNYQQISRYLNDNSTLEDRTAGKSYKGQRKIIEFWRLSTQGMRSYRFEQQRFFVSKKLAVFIGEYHYQGEGTLYGFPEQQIKFSIPAVTVLTIDTSEQLITLHQDFFDYASLAPTIIN